MAALMVPLMCWRAWFRNQRPMPQEDQEMNDPRSIARALANEAVSAGRPLDWFEPLYAKALSEGALIPWADRVPNPNLIELYKKVRHLPFGKRALKVGCGLGDDAEWLAAQGFHVIAFDISSSAIKTCRHRSRLRRYATSQRICSRCHPRGRPLSIWCWSLTSLQVLPAEFRAGAMKRIGEFVAPNGFLLLITRAREERDPAGAMPWPLTRREIDGFLRDGFIELHFVDYMDQEKPPVRRFRACYQRISA